jgi:hypothetical protein
VSNRVTEFGVSWDERVPRNHVKHLLGQLHVSLKDDEIEREINRRIDLSPAVKQFTPALRRQTVRYALLVHQRNRQLFTQVMQGNLK